MSKTLTQCLVCTRCYTKDGKPTLKANLQDKLIYGCKECRGDHYKEGKPDLELVPNFKGYLKVSF